MKKKVCCKCGRIKPIESFSPDNSLVDGIRSACRVCVNARRRQLSWERGKEARRKKKKKLLKKEKQKRDDLEREKRKEANQRKITRGSRFGRSSKARRWTIEKCMIMIGAPEDEVRFNAQWGGHSLHRNDVRGVHQIKLLDVMDGGTILYWGKHLYRNFMIKNHPDKHPKRFKFYDHRCRNASEAFMRLRRVLSHHGTS